MIREDQMGDLKVTMRLGTIPDIAEPVPRYTRISWQVIESIGSSGVSSLMRFKNGNIVLARRYHYKIIEAHPLYAVVELIDRHSEVEGL